MMQLQLVVGLAGSAPQFAAGLAFAEFFVTDKMLQALPETSLDWLVSAYFLIQHPHTVFPACFAMSSSWKNYWLDWSACLFA